MTNQTADPFGLADRTTDQLVKKIVTLRDERSALAAKDKLLAGGQDIIAEELLVRARKEGCTGFKTPHGTTYIAEEVRFSMADDLTFMNWVKEHGEVELLERRVSVKNVQEYMENHEDQIPPGLNFFKQDRMKVRRSSK